MDAGGRWLQVLRRAALVALLLAAPPAGRAAEAPEVVASIRPVHSLVAAVMQGVRTPDLLVPAGASPHAYALRPSDARKLARAAVVFQVGPALETFLKRPLAALAGRARVVSLMDAPGVVLLKTRTGSTWESEAGQEEARGHRAGDGAINPHLWLDPVNARAWVREIVRVLGQVDPVHAPDYARNADALDRRLEALTAELERTLAPVRGKPYIVFHDAYQYFEARFGLDAVGAVTVSPERAPGARRLAAIREKVRRLDAVCVFAEPQFEPGLLRTVTEGTTARTGVLDPLGTGLPDGPDLYFALMRALAADLKRCLLG